MARGSRLASRVDRRGWQVAAVVLVLGFCLRSRVTAYELGALGFLPGQAGAQVFSIDPATGSRNPLLSTSAVALTGAPIGFDPATRRLFFEDGADLWTADLAHGTTSHVPLSSCCPYLQYDTQADVLLGLGFLPGQIGAQIFSIDPVTGSSTPLLSTSATALTGAPIGFDPATRRLFFEDGADLWTADLAHGTASHVPLSSCCPYLFFLGGGVSFAVPLLGETGFAALAIGLALVGLRLANARA